ncbi:GTP-sensing pleiotropic transcriptional regulator CodY [Carnobacterium sp. CS13]|uniref:GTP-sensing pleiotropic transcriptional regulator CodY n=1 Tax=Carnobacterium sp. CS13 TaxID=2800128 RepID=UPI001913DC14|nr:GTP-sensing pleiotropic transcriptional regulator CodY [Carnobacterium sp. CS13]QQP69285.1 GTP-sensing pleiotropic transcriptional regulator CodY [Carnobacterium sp. CS13]
MSGLLQKMRKINNMLQKKGGVVSNGSIEEGNLPFTDMAVILGDVLNANTYLIDEAGNLLGYTEKHEINNERVKEMLDAKKFPLEYALSMLEIKETRTNIGIESDYTVFPIETRDLFIDGLTTVIPIYAAGERLGTLILARLAPQFDDDDLILGEHAATVVGIEILYKKSTQIEEEARDSANVQIAIKTLSYSELKAVKAIFEELGGLEGRLTASNVADKIGITRSVIVNALRKLESGGIIESKSLGMKGTYIRIHNTKFIEALDKEWAY